MAMTAIKLDASKWRTSIDFCAAMLAALGSPDWHGTSVGALVDSMIYGGINKVQPPYRIEIRLLEEAGPEARDEVYAVMGALAEHGASCRILGRAIAAIEVVGPPST